MWAFAKVKLLKRPSQEPAEASQGLGTGDEGWTSTPGKADLVRPLLRVTESISDRDINNSGFAGERSQINR